MSVELRPILKRGWSITESNPSDVFGDMERVDNVNGVVMIEFPIEQGFRAGATSFDTAFLDDSPEHMFYEALLQLACRCNDIVRRRLHGTGGGRQAANPDAGGPAPVNEANPIQSFIEVVLSKDENPQLDPLQYGSTEENIQSRVFMRGVNDNIDVIAYRLWIFLRYTEPACDYGSVWLEILADAEKAYHNFKDGVNKKMGEESAEGISMSSYSGSNESARYGSTLKKQDRWKLIRSRKLFADVIDLTLGRERYSRRETLQRILNPQTTDRQNPVNPLYSLSPQLYFQWPTSNILEDQAKFENYQLTPDGHRWGFPRNDLVVRISPDDEHYDRLSKKLFPDYQVRSIGDSPFDEQARRMRAKAASRYKRQVLQDGALQVTRRNMRARRLEFGEAGDLDLTTGDTSTQHMVDTMSDPMCEDVGLPMADGGGGTNQEAQRENSIIDPSTVQGGTTPAEIMRMLSTTSDYDANGNVPLYDAAALQREDFEGSGSLAALKLLSPSDLPTRSDFHMVRFQGALLRTQLDDRIVAAEREGMPEPREMSRRAYLGMQSRIIRDYVNKCTQSSSNISKRARFICEWFEQRSNEDRIKLMPPEEQQWLGVCEPLIDDTLSVFGNLLARRMLRLEASAFVTSTHSVIMTILFGSLDAYRHAFDLHYHVLLTGPNSTGKSFILEKIRDLRIPQTVAKVDTETKSAPFVDVDLNDQIDYCEEVKPDAYRTKEMGGNDTDEASLKEFLTSMRRVRTVFMKEENGRRNQRTAASQQISSRLSATNLTQAQVSAPMRSRHSIFPIEQRTRHDRVTSHLSGIEKRLGLEARDRAASFHDEMCIEQFLHYHCEKLIACHALHEPTLEAFEAVNQIVSKYLQDRHNIKLQPRTVERARIMARSMTISLACEYLYSTPGSRFYKMPFDYMSMRELDPLLHDTAEIAFCAFDAVRHEILDDRQQVVMRLIREQVFEPDLERSREAAHETHLQTVMRQNYMMPETKIQTSRFGTDADLGERSQEHGISRARTGGRSGMGGRMLAMSGFNDEESLSSLQSMHTQILAQDKFSREYMYAYARVGMTYMEMSQRVALLSTTTDTPITHATVRSIMRHMSQSNIVSHQYRWDEANARPVVDERRTRVRLPALIYAADCVFVALEALADSDPLNDAIMHCQSKNMFDEHKYVTMVPLDNDHPHLLRVRYMGPKDGRQHQYTDYARQITASSIYAYSTLSRLTGKNRPALTSGARRLQYDYDELSRRGRCEALFLDPDEDSDMCSFAPYERACREIIEDRAVRRQTGLRAAHVVVHTIEYPQGIIDMDASSMVRPLDEVLDVERPVPAPQAVERAKKRVVGDMDEDEVEDVSIEKPVLSTGIVSGLATGFIQENDTSPTQPPLKRRPLIIGRRK